MQRPKSLIDIEVDSAVRTWRARDRACHACPMRVLVWFPLKPPSWLVKGNDQARGPGLQLAVGERQRNAIELMVWRMMVWRTIVLQFVACGGLGGRDMEVGC